MSFKPKVYQNHEELISDIRTGYSKEYDEHGNEIFGSCACCNKVYGTTRLVDNRCRANIYK